MESAFGLSWVPFWTECHLPGGRWVGLYVWFVLQWRSLSKDRIQGGELIASHAMRCRRPISIRPETSARDRALHSLCGGEGKVVKLCNEDNACDTMVRSVILPSVQYTNLLITVAVLHAAWRRPTSPS